MEKPITADPEQRRAQTRAARHQSGLPPEDETPPKTEMKKRERPKPPAPEKK